MLLTRHADPLGPGRAGHPHQPLRLDGRARDQPLHRHLRQPAPEDPAWRAGRDRHLEHGAAAGGDAGVARRRRCCAPLPIDASALRAATTAASPRAASRPCAASPSTRPEPSGSTGGLPARWPEIRDAPRCRSCCPLAEIERVMRAAGVAADRRRPRRRPRPLPARGRRGARDARPLRLPRPRGPEPAASRGSRPAKADGRAAAGHSPDEERSPLAAVLDLLSTDEQRRTRIAWLYYVEGLTQAEIADRLAVSRVKVVRDLQIGRQTGLVQIQINGRLASCVALERALERRFGLRAGGGGADPARRGASARDPGRGARLLALRPARRRPDAGRRLGPHAALERARAAPPRAAGAHRRVAAGRHRPRLGDQHVRDRLARRRDAGCAVLLSGGPGLRQLARPCATCCWPRPGSTTCWSAARRADIAMVSVGTLGPDCHQPPHRPARGGGRGRAAEALGAVGDLLCTFLDAEGRPVDHPLNGCAVGLPVADLQRIPARRPGLGRSREGARSSGRPWSAATSTT